MNRLSASNNAINTINGSNSDQEAVEAAMLESRMSYSERQDEELESSLILSMSPQRLLPGLTNSLLLFIESRV